MKEERGEIKKLKQYDLSSVQRPKTLIILHYKGKRISVPIFSGVTHVTQFMIQNIVKFEERVLGGATPNDNLLCFQTHKQNANHPLADGDLRMDIFLSFFRRLELPSWQADLTKFYKFIEIEPYFANLHPQNYTLLRLLKSTPIYNLYLARKVVDGKFYFMKAYAQNCPFGIAQYKAIKNIQSINKSEDTYEECVLSEECETFLVPQPQQEDDLEKQNPEHCKHIVIIQPYCAKGTLRQVLRDKKSTVRLGKRLNEMDCLTYLKELVWIVCLLHRKYNLMHRGLTIDNFWVDHTNHLRIASFATCLQCYDTQGRYLLYSCDQMKETKFQFLEEGFQTSSTTFSLGQHTPPEIAQGSYDFLVDFYAVGTIIKFMLQHVMSLGKDYEKTAAMDEILAKLTSNQTDERFSIVNDMMESIERDEDETHLEVHQCSALVLSDMPVGCLQFNTKCTVNQAEIIDHSILKAFFQTPLIKVTESSHQPSHHSHLESMKKNKPSYHSKGKLNENKYVPHINKNSIGKNKIKDNISQKSRKSQQTIKKSKSKSKLDDKSMSPKNKSISNSKSDIRPSQKSLTKSKVAATRFSSTLIVPRPPLKKKQAK